MASTTTKTNSTTTPPNRIVIFAPTATGKTAFFQALVGDEFDHSRHGPTIGASFIRHKFPTGETFDIWDTNGLESSQQKLWSMYVPNTTHIILGISITSTSSEVARMEEWIKTIDENNGQCPSKAHKYCVIFRCDLNPNDEYRTFYDIANRYGFKCFECSALTGQGIQQIQEELIHSVRGDERFNFNEHIDVDFEHKRDNNNQHSDDQHADVDVESKSTQSKFNSKDQTGCIIQ